MLSGRGLLALGCVVTLAVMVGIIGAVAVLGGFSTALLAATRANPPAFAPTPTPPYVESMKPIPGRIDGGAAGGVTMWARRDGGDFWFLSNGTRVQIIQTDGTYSQVQVMTGPDANRVGWIPTNSVST